jgi:aspartate/methionine/tyrosine aminotransferase
MAVAAEAAKLRAQGVNLVDFGAGDPHFPTPRHIMEIPDNLTPQRHFALTVPDDKYADS